MENVPNGIIQIGNHVLYHVAVANEHEHLTVEPRQVLFLVLVVPVQHWNAPPNNVIRINVLFGRPDRGRTALSRVRLAFDHEWFHVFIILEKWKENFVKNHRDHFYQNAVIQISHARNGLTPIGLTVP